MYFRVDQKSTFVVRRFIHVFLIVFATMLLLLVVLGTVVTHRAAVITVGVLENSRTFTLRSASDGIISRVLCKPNEPCSVGDTLVTFECRGLQIARDKLIVELAQCQRKLAECETALQAERVDHELEIERASIRRQEAKLSADYQQELYDMTARAGEVSGDSAQPPPLPMDLRYALLALRSAENDCKRAMSNNSYLHEFENESKSLTTQIELIQHDIEAMDKRIRDCNVVAPLDGHVYFDRFAIVEGQWVARGEVILHIADRSQWQLSCLVPQQDVIKCRSGQSVLISFSEFDDGATKEYQGSVLECFQTPQNSGRDPNGAIAFSPMPLYKVTVSMSTAEYEGAESLNSGMTADVRIVVGEETLMSSLLGESFGKVEDASRKIMQSLGF